MIAPLLAEQPQILDLAVQTGKMKPEGKENALEVMEIAKEKGQSVFAGEAAVMAKAISQEDLDYLLVAQSAAKSTAAVKDLQTIIRMGDKLEAPQWLKANWGNNGVNKAKTGEVSKDTAVADAVSAAANIAQNITMTVNDNPQLLQESGIFAKLADDHADMTKALESANKEPQNFFKKVISDLANLVRGMINGNSAVVPIDNKAGEWMESAKVALKAIEQSGVEINDAKGQRIDMNSYIKERFSEIERGLDVAKDVNRGRDAGRQIL